MIRCVVFDVDDTLYLERDYVRSGFEAVGRWAKEALGADGLASVAWAAFEEGRRGDLFDHALAVLGVEPSPEHVQELVRRYRSHRPAISLLPDAVEALGALSGRVPVAVVTDGPVVSQRAKVDALGLARLAAPVVLTAELGEGFGKPHPRAFQLVEAAVGQSGASCVYVADNPAKDFAGPAALGWRTVRVARAGGLHAKVPSGPDVQVEMCDLTSLYELTRGAR